MKKRKNKSLSIDQARRIFRAGPPIQIGTNFADPVAIRALSSIVQERLVSRGGRPSDPSWTIVRKVPMRPSTWTELERVAERLERFEVRVSAGQIAAIALEQGLLTTARTVIASTSRIAEPPPASTRFSPEVQDHAGHVLDAILSNGGTW